MDYYGSMTLPPRRFRLAAAALLSLSACAHNAPSTAPAAPPTPAAVAAPAAPPPRAAVAAPDADKPAKEPAQPSAMTAQSFYEVLVGEMSLRTGEAGAGFSLLLDSARRTRDPKLFQRATEVALQARSADAALEAVRAWKETLPDSHEARRLELQILIAMGRLSETPDLLKAELADTPLPERPALMNIVASTYSRASDKKLAASVLESGMADQLQSPQTAAPAWAAIGRVRLAAGDAAGALDAARRGYQADPAADGPALLALELAEDDQPQADAMLKDYLASKNASANVRSAYARALAQAGRLDEASQQLTLLTAQKPELPESWLLLGTLQAQARKNVEAQASIQRYLALAAQTPETLARSRGEAQAYFVLSQLAERRKDYPAALDWLDKVDSPDDVTATQLRRAGLLARQGKMTQARAAIGELPEDTPDQRRQKFQATVQLLRDAGQYQEAYDLLAKASAADPRDRDLIYDRAMVAEKLDRMEEMERLLRQLIAMDPENQNAYNALGYSLADRNIRLEEARTLIRRAVQLAPDDPFIADSLGWVEFRMGNTAEAMRILDEAYKKRPDPEIGAHLGEVLWASGQQDRAMTIWKQALAADADNQTLRETLKRLRVRP